VISLLITSTACGSKTDAPPRRVFDDAAIQHRTEELPLTHFPDPVIALPKQEVFELLEPGQATDRAPLVYTLVDGTTEHRFTTTLSSRQQTDAAWSAPDKIAITDGFAVTIAKGSPVALRALPADTGQPSTDVSVAYVKKWHEEVEGRRITAKLDARGAFTDLTFIDDPTATKKGPLEDVTQRLLVALVPVPIEPVGIGAKWRVITILKHHPALVKQTATYELVARTPTGWKIAVELRRVAEEQLVKDPSLPTGMAVQLIALLRRYTGTLEIDPTKALPIGGKLAVESRMHLRVGRIGTKFSEQILEDTGAISVTTATSSPGG